MADTRTNLVELDRRLALVERQPESAPPTLLEISDGLRDDLDLARGVYLAALGIRAAGGGPDDADAVAKLAVQLEARLQGRLADIERIRAAE